MRKIARYLIIALMKLLGSLPLGFHLAVGRFIGWLAGSVLRYRKETVMVNLARSFPDAKYDELCSMAKSFYRSLGQIVGEAVWYGASSTERVRRQRIVETANPEELERLRASSDSVVMLTGHFGNWELLGNLAVYNYTDTPYSFDERQMVIVHKELSSKLWEEIFAHNRQAPLKYRKEIDGYVESGNVLRFMFSHKDEKRVYIFINDQSPYSQSRNNIDLEFMHQPTRAMSAAAAVAHKMGHAVVYSGMKRVSPGHYRIEFTTICEDASKMETAEIVRRFYELLQRDIESQPESYTWSHRRWKHKIENHA